MITLSELQIKDVIVVDDGKRLGNITDLEIDVDHGRITFLVIGLKGKMMGLFGREEEVVIPWESIVTIGSDVILVKKQKEPTLYTEKSE
ncbi:YlmC/YmxH family sporulation protein [Sediminibacillus dalangtanensis]|uniref:YlmC/YmxH family sporulation protein n=1 Tax=Sediminibacillus dalangtanensis TaxID=2729421 RepID=A0ABX7VV49_9BACI|nr:YlmC/YmxH family sporulation protein [Sediminibacillus dalangtanensis]QTM99343.1 YlmC/YmxH family sporulation protein [Sediminibacillus dalangtanensis]